MSQSRLIDNQFASVLLAEHPDLVFFGIEIAQDPVLRDTGVVPFECIGVPDYVDLEPVAHLDDLVKLRGRLELVEAAQHVEESLIVTLRGGFRETAGYEKRRESRQAHQLKAVVLPVFSSAVHFNIPFKIKCLNGRYYKQTNIAIRRTSILYVS